MGFLNQKCIGCWVQQRGFIPPYQPSLILSQRASLHRLISTSFIPLKTERCRGSTNKNSSSQLRTSAARCVQDRTGDHDLSNQEESNQNLSEARTNRPSSSYEGSNGASSKYLSGGPENVYRSNKSNGKSTNGAENRVSESESAEWKNVFPSYLQSKEDESDGENDELVQVLPVNQNGQSRGRMNGVAAAKAAAAATASAKALESHVNGLNFPSTPALATPPCSSARLPTEGKNLNDLISYDPIWAAIRAEARLEAEREPLLSSFLYASILAHPCFERSLGFVLANRLTSATLLATQLMDVFDEVFLTDPFIRQAIRLDVQAVKDRDPSCRFYSSALLYLKGYHALQAHRVAHWLWNRGSTVLALALQARMSEVFAVDIHPAARIGKAVLLDHGTGVVIGETAVIGDRVSMLQGVTLGGTGKDAGDRHPKIQEGVLIGAGATILGNIVVGRGAMVAAGSLVLKDVPAHRFNLTCSILYRTIIMVAGTPAKVVGFLEESTPAETMKHDAAQDFCQELEEAVGRQSGENLWGGAGI
uniref:serine O-acetyltransferase n=1 Tax=Physcomitrium patens TaxID=3218 RepID=A0A7I4CB77_PHYPA